MLSVRGPVNISGKSVRISMRIEMKHSLPDQSLTRIISLMNFAEQSKATDVQLPKTIIEDIELTANAWIDGLSIRRGKELKGDIRQRLFKAIVTDLSQLVIDNAIRRNSSEITYRNVCEVQEQGVTNLLNILPSVDIDFSSSQS